MIINTRPVERQEHLNRAARALGHDVVSCPVLETNIASPSAAMFTDVDALIMTSRTAVYASAAAPRALPVYAVGPATAAAARNAEFETVVDGGGTAETLLRIIDTAPFTQGLYLSARHVSCDLSVERPARIRRHEVYHMAPANDLTQSAVDALQASEPVVVPFYSPRSLAVFKDLIEKSGLQPRLETATAIYIHPRLHHTCTLPWGRVRISSSPDGNGMDAALRGVA